MSFLSIRNLSVSLAKKTLLDGVSFEVGQGKIVAIAGGSGSGKTTIGLSILRLLPAALKIRDGSILFRGRNLLELSGERMRQQRGGAIGMVFQEPLSAFDPLFTIGRQMNEVLSAHTRLNAAQRHEKILEVLGETGLTETEQVYRSFPHQLSGGMRQRAMVAQAMVCGPSLIIADEPTSSLDVALQTKIVELFRQLRAKGISILLIAHDLGMISKIADEVIILRQGIIVEQGPVQNLIAQPRHDYTKALIEAFQ